MAGRQDNTVQMAQLMAVLAVAVAGGDERQLNIAMSAGANAAANNYLNHDQWADFAKALKACDKDPLCEAESRAKYADLGKKQDAALAVCDRVGNCDALKKEVADGRAYQIELVKNGQLPDSYLGAFDLQQLGLKLANQPAYREQVGKSVVAQMMCQLSPKQCDVESAKMAVALGVAMAGGPAAAYLLSSLPTIAAAAKMSIAACSANPRLCANEAGLVVSDLLAGEALGGASIAGGAQVARALSKVEAEAEAARIIAQREATLKLPNPADGTAAADAGSVRNVNPTGSMQNCTNCAYVVDNQLATGASASALPRSEPLSYSELNSLYNTKFSSWTDQASIEKTLLAGGNGTRAVVYGMDADHLTAHVWNAVVQNGKINYIDGQTGAGGIGNFANFPHLTFGITSKGGN